MNAKLEDEFKTAVRNMSSAMGSAGGGGGCAQYHGVLDELKIELQTAVTANAKLESDLKKLTFAPSKVTAMLPVIPFCAYSMLVWLRARN